MEVKPRAGKWKMTVGKGMWSFTTTRGVGGWGGRRAQSREEEEGGKLGGKSQRHNSTGSQSAVRGTGGSSVVSSRAPYGSRLTLPGTALPSLAQARASDTAFARLSLTHLLSSCPRTALEAEVRALKTPLAKLVFAYEDRWCKKKPLCPAQGVHGCGVLQC